MTDLEAQTMSLEYTYDGITYSLPTKSAETCLVDLELTFECQSNGQHKWKVKNPNIQTSVDVTWWTDPDHGSGSVSSLNSGSSAYFYTDSSAHTAYVSYEYAGETHTTEKSAESCMITLELDYECLEDGRHEWTVTNPNAVDVDFNWRTSSPDQGDGVPINVPAGGTATFYTDNTAHTAYVEYVFGEVTFTTEKSADVCLVPLELDYECHEFNGSHIWTVTNTNGFEIEFTWETEDGLQSGGPVTISAGPGATEIFTTDGTPHKVILSYQYEGEDKSVEKEAEACKSSDLILSYLCGYASDDSLYWSVTNPYNAEIEVSWEVEGETEKGTITALANGDTIFTTTPGIKTVIILVDGIKVNEEDGGEACLLELMLTYNCLDNGKQQWTVTNDNPFDQPYTWSSTSGDSGSGTIEANNTDTFITDNEKQTVTIEYQNAPFPAKSTAVIAEECKVSIDKPETTTAYTTITPEEGIEWIIFHTLRNGNLEIYRLDGREGVGEYKLYNLSKGNGINSHPSRSLDNEWVAFQSNRDGNFEIYVTDNVGNEQTRLTDNPARDTSPVFSPDNINIVFQSNRNGSWDLYLVNRITGVEVQLTDHSGDETNASFSSVNANFIVYESNQNGSKNIFLLNIVTGEEYQITNGEEDELYPVLSPNGQKVAYLSPVDGVWNLFVIGINGDNKIQITNDEGYTMNHSWSPDGTRIAYQSKRSGNIDIYTFDVRDGTEYRLTDNIGQDTAPTWDINGNNIYYTSKIGETALDIYKVFWKGGEPIYMTDHPSSDMRSE
jgi:TolB protein